MDKGVRDLRLHLAGDRPEVIAVDQRHAVSAPRSLFTYLRPTQCLDPRPIFAEQSAFVGAAHIGRQHGGEMIGDIHRPATFLQNLPVDQPERAVGLVVDIARMSVAMNKAERPVTHLGGECL